MKPDREAEKLLDELEKIYLCSGWRKDKEKAAKVKLITDRLGVLLK